VVHFSTEKDEERENWIYFYYMGKGETIAGSEGGRTYVKILLGESWVEMIERWAEEKRSVNFSWDTVFGSGNERKRQGKKGPSRLQGDRERKSGDTSAWHLDLHHTFYVGRVRKSKKEYKEKTA